jgi:hypothetical protein
MIVLVVLALVGLVAATMLPRGAQPSESAPELHRLPARAHT